MEQKEIQKMFDNAVHIGHRTHKWNPKMKKYIYGEVNGIYVINLEKTAKLLLEAMNFIAKAVGEGKTILFVSTKPQAINVLEQTAKECAMPYVVAKWIPGLLTNFGTIKLRIKYLADLKAQLANGEFDKYTKKEASKLKKEIEKLEVALGGVQSLNKEPDLIFVLDVLRDKIVVKEAKKLGIPVIGIVDTNSDPTSVEYPVPGNDDALKSIVYFLDKVKESIFSARKKK